MGLEINYNDIEEKTSFGNEGQSYVIYKTRETHVKILIENDNNELIPCRCQRWFYTSDYNSSHGNFYRPAGEPVKIESLEEIDLQFFKDTAKEGERFHDFISELMENASSEADYVFYHGAVMTYRVKGWMVIFARLFNWPEVIYDHKLTVYKKK